MFPCSSKIQLNRFYQYINSKYSFNILEIFLSIIVKFLCIFNSFNSLFFQNLIKMKKNLPFHIVTNRLITLSFRSINIIVRTVIWIYSSSFLFLIVNFFNTLTIIILRFHDIIRERTFQGLHTLFLVIFLKVRIILFILWEIIFFRIFLLNILQFLAILKLI